MNDITISVQALAVVSSLLTALVVVITTQSGVIAILYRQILKERDGRLDERNRVLDERNARLEERDARLVDQWRDLEEKEIRIVALEGANERLQKLAENATEGWYAEAQGRVRPS